MAVVVAVTVAGDDVAALVSAASDFSKAAMVAASTWPVGLTPNFVCMACKAFVRSSLQTPSIGPSQKPVSLRAVWSAVICMASFWSTAPSLSWRAFEVASSTKPVTGSPLSVWSFSTAAAVSGP